MISSPTNAHVKYIRSLNTQRKERVRERSFVLEGVRLVAEALTAGVPLRRVLYAPDQLAATAAGVDLLAQLALLPNSYATSARALAAAADTVTPQGVLAVAAWPDVPPRAGVVLALDALQDPGNVGTLLRSAEAAGVGQVLALPGTADVFSPKVVRAAMGAHWYVPLHPLATWDAVAALAAEGHAIYAATADGTLPHYAADWQRPAVLLVGNESQGVSAAGLALATHRLAIPMVGRTESLNAAVAGSVVMFEALRQRRAPGAPAANEPDCMV